MTKPILLLMTPEIGLVLAIIGLALVLFISEWQTIDTVAILVMVAFMATGILTPKEGFQGFTNPATLTVGAMFIISYAIFHSGALSQVGVLLKQASGAGYFLLLLTVMSTTSILSGMVNNTAVVALLIPVLLNLSREEGRYASRLLMPLSFAGIMGGVCTLIGTSTNILVSGIAEDRGLAPIGMFEMTGAGLVFLGTGFIYMLFFGRHLLPKRKQGGELEDIYDMGHFITRVQLKDNSPSAGQMLKDSNLTQQYQFEVLQIAKPEGDKLKAAPDTTLEAGDILTIRSKAEHLSKIAGAEGITIFSPDEFSASEAMEQSKIFEALVAPESQFIGQTFAEAPFSDISETASLLGIRSRQKISSQDLENINLQSGDVLLIRGAPEEMKFFHQSDDLLVITEMEGEEQKSGRYMWPAIGILLGVIAIAALGWAPIVLTACAGALLLVLIGAISTTEAYRAIDWKVIFMLGGVLSMGAALEKTGADQLLANTIVEELGQLGPRFVLSGFFIITLIASNIMSNNASAALLAPIAITVASQLDVAARPFLMAVTYAASLSFIMPMGYQTNTMVYTPGNYQVGDYVKVGAPLTLLLWIVATFVIPFFFPF